MNFKISFPSFLKSIGPFLKALCSFVFIILFFYLILAIRGDIPKARAPLMRLPFMLNLIVERDELQARSKLVTLNYYIPEFEYLADFIIRPQKQFDLPRLTGFGGYLPYYQKAVETLPLEPHAHAMLGFCYYYKGDLSRALQEYQKAISLNPYFFWFHYNKGILLLKDKKYELAKESFQKALATNPDSVFRMILSSKIYQQIIFSSSANMSALLVERLKSGYADCYRLLTLTNRFLLNPPASLDSLDEIPLRIF